MKMKKSENSYHHGALREALLSLAEEELNRGHRIEEISVRALAEEAGVSKAAPRRHFPTADHLIAAVAARGFARLERTLSEVPSGDVPELGYRYVRFALSHPQLYRGMYHFPADRVGEFPDLADAATAAYARLAQSIAAYRAGGGGQRLTSDEATLAAWAFVHGIADLAIQRLTAGVSPGDEEGIRRIVAALVAGL